MLVPGEIHGLAHKCKRAPDDGFGFGFPTFSIPGTYRCCRPHYMHRKMLCMLIEGRHEYGMISDSACLCAGLMQSEGPAVMCHDAEVICGGQVDFYITDSDTVVMPGKISIEVSSPEKSASGQTGQQGNLNQSCLEPLISWCCCAEVMTSLSSFFQAWLEP